MTKENKMLRRLCFETPIGTLCLEEDGEALTAIRLGPKCEEEQDESELLNEAKKQIMEYFAGKRTQFDLPLHMHGTEFQVKVWNALRQIPYGETRSYSEIAAAAGNPKACRAVGGANNKNPLLIVVPCHRVIGKNGSLVGFACGMDAKKHLLELEKCGGNGL